MRLVVLVRPALSLMAFCTVVRQADSTGGRGEAANWAMVSTYPPVSNMGIFVALAVPLEDPANAVSLSYFFEANYVLPDNASSSSRRQRSRLDPSLDRSTVYALVQSKFESAGLPGRHCLQRSICEASEHPLQLHNGLLGDVLRVLFTPSSSRPEDQLPDGVGGAELAGRNGNCSDYHSLCPLGLFDAIGRLL